MTCKSKRSHLFIPDTQVKEGVCTEHIKAAGLLIVKRRPDAIIVIGDWWDFPSLGMHTDRGSIYYHNKDYVTDLEAGINAMQLLLGPLEKLQARQRKAKKKVYSPELHFTLGNHEYRRNRLEEQQPKFKGALPTAEAYLWDKGFNVVPYKQYVCIDGVNYSHNCPQTSSAGCVSRAHLIMQKRNSSWSVGHSQLLDYHVSPHFPRLQCLIAGAFYTHEEDYKQGSNDHWRGLVYKHGVHEGTYDPEFITTDRICNEYL